MKKSVMVVLALALAACSANEQAAQQEEAARLFAQAKAHVENATCGYNNSEATGAKFEGTLDAYVDREYGLAADVLKSITSLGSPSQQASAALLLSEVQAARAEASARQADMQWAAQSALSGEILQTLATARTAQMVADAQGGADAQQLLNDLGTERQSARELATQHQAKVDELQRQIAGLTSDRDGLLKQVTTYTAAAEKLSQQAEAADGQKRFDTYKKAAEVSRQAAEASAKADQLAAQAKLLTAALTVSQANLAMATEQAEQLTKAIAQVDSQNTQNKTTTADARKTADAAATRLTASLAKLSEDHIKGVIQPFDSARADLAATIESLGSAVSKDPSQADALKLAKATRQYQLALITSRYASILGAYNNLVGMLAEQSVTGFAAQTVAPIREAAKLADESASRIAGEAVKEMATATAALQDVARSAGNAEVKAAAQSILNGMTPATGGGNAEI